MDSRYQIGFCECGCGRETSNCRGRGRKKGEYARFIMGHNAKGKNNPNWNGGKYINKLGYVLIWQPNHPRSDNSGYIREHTLICEKALGKALPIRAETHHIDGNPSNNANNNLTICQDVAYHRFLHQRTRAYKACGHASWRKCQFCKQYDDPINLIIHIKKYSTDVYHKKCRSKHRQEKEYPKMREKYHAQKHL